VGLDTYPSRTPDHTTLTPEDHAALDELDLPLCEFGPHGGFRGKVYEDLVHRVTAGALSLYQLWIPPEEVAEMAAAFEACDPEAVAQASEADYYPATADEVRALRYLLRLCANRGLGLYGDI
jgi:hypothetical protein